TGHVHAYNTMAILDTSPIRRIKINTGNNANGAVLRKSSKTGVNKSRANEYQPINKPNAIAAAKGNKNPNSERKILASKCLQSSPVIIKFHHALITSEKGGKNVLSTIPTCGANSHNSPNNIRTTDFLKTFTTMDGKMSFFCLFILWTKVV